MACSILSKGGFVGDDIVNQLVAKRISRCSSGFLLDGYPRTLPQATFLDATLSQQALGPVTAIHLDVPASIIVERITSRRQCPKCGHIYNLHFQPPTNPGRCNFDSASLITREDDREQVIRERLKVYEELTGPVVAHYANARYYRVDGTLPPDEVSAQIERALDVCPIPALS